MKRFKLLICMLLSTGATFAQTRRDYDMAANKVQTFYNKNQPDEIYKMFTPRVSANMTLEKTRGMVADMHQKFGSMKSYTYIKQDDQFSFYKIDYAKGQLILVICLTKENKFQNFRFIAYDANYDKLR